MALLEANGNDGFVVANKVDTWGVEDSMELIILVAGCRGTGSPLIAVEVLGEACPFFNEVVRRLELYLMLLETFCCDLPLGLQLSCKVDFRAFGSVTDTHCPRNQVSKSGQGNVDDVTEGELRVSGKIDV